MVDRLSRREALQYLGLGTAAWSPLRWLAACGDARSSRATEHWEQADWEASVGSVSLDPSRPWWEQWPYAPIEQEREAFDLEVQGEIPRELDGLFVRNGANPQNGYRGHWFLGDGMLHGVRIQDGRARWYRNRYVQTPLLGRDPGEQANPVLNPAENPSNTAVVHHAGRMLSISESGHPFEISKADLSTVGVYDFGGKLGTAMTAHPKLDPRTGELHMLGCSVVEPYLTYHLVDATGGWVRSEPITLPRSVMVHDIQITDTRIVFMDLPIVFDVAAAASGVPMPFGWKEEAGARIGIMPRAGGDEDVIWIDIDPCYVFHGLNAYDDDDGSLVLDVLEYPYLWRDSNETFDTNPSLVRYTLDTSTRSAKRALIDDRPAEFPRIDPRRVGRVHRYGYAFWANTLNVYEDIHEAGLVKYDRVRGTTTVRTLQKGTVAGEPIFVPKSQSSAEDEGFVLSLNVGRETSTLDIVDARAFTSPALARVRLPGRIPLGFHAEWIAG